MEARRLVDSLRETCGERHPHYATALSNLALSLQKQGDYAGAEPLLRQVLEVRLETLGEHHPHYATALNNVALLLCERGDCARRALDAPEALDIRRESLGDRHPDHATGLTSLAMLLCERRDLAGAEPLLRQALDLRREVLGERHPHYATALNNLALLLRERGDCAGAEPLLRRALDLRREMLGERHPNTLSCESALESVRRAGPPEPVARAVTKEIPRVERARDARALRDEVNALGDRFARASEQMAEAVQRMRSFGLPPDEGVLENAASCRRDFARLRTEVLQLAGSVGTAGSSSPEVVGLLDLSTLLESTAKTQAALRRYDEVRRRALGLIEQVLDLRGRDEGYGDSLRQIQSQAQAVRRAIASSTAPSLPADAERLAAGEHPLVALLRMSRSHRELNDETWAELFGTVAAAFGKSVAVALARHRISLPEPSPSPYRREDRGARAVLV